MQTSYSGIYTLQSGGGIDSVKVSSPGGNVTLLAIEAYDKRCVKPPINQLLSYEEFKVLLHIHQNSEDYPILETTEIQRLVVLKYMSRITVPVANEEGMVAIINYNVTDKGLKLINQYNGI